MITIKDFANFIQEYIYKEGWTELRDVQIEAAEAIYKTNKDLLIASPTASGKTEAALFPIITNMYKNPKTGVATLYVSPLKALINDQFIRLNDVLQEGDIKVFRWHGDVNSYQKEKALNTDNILLQITPESIESLFINHTEDLKKLFSNLKYIIIDEVHYFMDSVRGIQLMSLIERIEDLVGHHIRRIGLSATIGNLEQAGEFVSSNNDVKIITAKQEHAKARIFVDYKNIEKDEDKKEYYKNLYHLINGKKCIVFANSKKQVENTAYNLKRINDSYGGNNYILVHHGNISKVLRDEVEQKMKKGDMPITAVATMTLELGIDLGKLERVIQIDSPHSISSFVQRLGRTGRKDGVKEMCFSFGVTESEGLPWNFIYSLAIISLYFKEKYIEPIKIDKYCYSVLLQQTLSYIATNPGIKANLLASKILNISVFKNISKEDYKLLLNYAIKCNLIENDNQYLSLAEMGERLVNSYDFYASFHAEKDYEVISNNKVIGSIQKKLPVGAKFNLAGSTWEVINIKKETKSITVKEVKGFAELSWEGSGLAKIDTLVMKQVKKILKEKQEFGFLSKSSKDSYNNIYNLYNDQSFINNDFIQIENNEYAYFPFLGTNEFLTLYYLLKEEFKYVKPVFSGFIPVCIILRVNNIKDVIDFINEININMNIKFDLNFYKENKYDEYIPEQLIRKSFLKNNLSINDLIEWIDK